MCAAASPCAMTRPMIPWVLTRIGADTGPIPQYLLTEFAKRFKFTRGSRLMRV